MNACQLRHRFAAAGPATHAGPQIDQLQCAVLLQEHQLIALHQLAACADWYSQLPGLLPGQLVSLEQVQVFTLQLVIDRGCAELVPGGFIGGPRSLLNQRSIDRVEDLDDSVRIRRYQDDP